MFLKVKTNYHIKTNLSKHQMSSLLLSYEQRVQGPWVNSSSTKASLAWTPLTPKSYLNAVNNSIIENN